MGQDGVEVHLRPLFRCYTRNRWVFKDTSIEKLHDVEVAAHNAFILAECIGFGNWDIGVLEGVDDAVLTIDLVCCLIFVNTIQAYTSVLIPSREAGPEASSS